MENGMIQTQLCRYEDLSEEIRAGLVSAPEHIFISGDCIYLKTGQQVFRFSNNPAGKELAYAIAHSRNEFASRPKNGKELYERIIREQEYEPDAALLRSLGIRRDRRICAAVFRSYNPLENDLYSTVSSMAPAEQGDTVIPYDYRTAVFVKNLDDQSDEEMKEFIEAVIGTMEAEGITGIRAGIGRDCSEISAIRRSCREALQALELGMRYRKTDHVFVYEKQTLERIVDAIPAEQKHNIRQMFFGRSPVCGLSEETLETVSVFFQNDLNLTAASKQLFIHRNTLNYRLDKIKKDFGLDLRSFQDAVIFKIICEIANEA